MDVLGVGFGVLGRKRATYRRGHDRARGVQGAGHVELMTGTDGRGVRELVCAFCAGFFVYDGMRAWRMTLSQLETLGSRAAGQGSDGRGRRCPGARNR